MDILQYDFFQNALIGSLLASILCGIVGTYIVSRDWSSSVEASPMPHSAVLALAFCWVAILFGLPWCLPF